MKNVPPSISETAFNCPHCGAFTTQHWAALFARPIESGKKTPSIASPVDLIQIQQDQATSRETKELLSCYVEKLVAGAPFIERNQVGSHLNSQVENLFLSNCYNCKGLALWVHEALVYPSMKSGAIPNQDIPENIRHDIEEAREIVEKSPRGAAALLRLAIQKLCSHLGESAKTIDEAIASLVKKGLNPVVQQSLDVVRVTGNEAVHPGTMDLKDDRKTAESLFTLVNIIAEQMITHPKLTAEMFNKLPLAKLEAIQRRDGEKVKQ